MHERTSRKGKGLLPGNPKQWQNEHNGLDLREDLGLSLDVSLPHERVFDLLPGVEVFAHGDLPAAQVYIEHVRGNGRWSGLSLPLPDGGAIVLYNDSHPKTRVRATLMEEFFHMRLRHPCSIIRLIDNGPTRTHHALVESEAYGSGAAALVPYKTLRELVYEGALCSEIADQFEVSEALVTFRAKVTKLYARLTKNSV